MLLRSLASGRGSFVKTATVVPNGFEVAVDSELSTRRVQHDRQRTNLFQGRCSSVEFILQAESSRSTSKPINYVEST